MKFDVIIVGAGPAGAFTAYNLAQAGIDVLILEKEELPRYKACGGGITLKTRSLLTEFDLTEVIEDRINQVVFSYNLEQPIELSLKKPVVFMTMRDKLDNFLVDKAKEVGATVRANCEVENIVVAEDKVEVNTADELFTAKIIVGADGVNSLVADRFNLVTDLEYAVAYEKELKVAGDRLAEQRGKINLDYGIVSKGYGWIFPKQDCLSVGIGSYKTGVSLKESLKKYLVGEKITGYQEIKAKGHPIPVGGVKRRLNDDSCLLVGDAAGLADPLSGEGIFYALKSGKVASQVIINNLVEGGSLDNYTQLINQEMVPEFKKSKLLSKLFFMAPGKIHKITTKRKWLLEELVKAVYGAESYSQLYKTFLSEIPFLGVLMNQ
ncbi:geranylgeranyl reductase family protein [Natroniella sulfidigena]|uniref:geranylgeranyl reductase family protein n=1 Tax=Natroniella sulfidigena TaxID=723921 RepID=UPI00200AD5F5|nr:geranylgeranyl reductase family protein [Natroniella sulfidigena]MCK8817453.1 geranylgeranyl reductase family protein [Natroniella sulfidigena]